MGKPRSPRFTLICTYLPCSQPFTVIQSQRDRAKYCSKLCHNRANAEAVHAKAHAIRPIRICGYEPCGTVFTVKPSDLTRKGAGTYCSKSCMNRGTALQKTRPLAERFWEKVAVAGPDECWLWQAGTFGNGYGKIWVPERGMTVGAHVVCWFLEHGIWPPDGINICHTCDTPPCVNLRHLWDGSQQANLIDASIKGHMSHRQNRRRGDAHPHVKLTEAILDEIEQLLASGYSLYKEIAPRFGVHYGSILRRLRTRKRHKGQLDIFH